MDRTPYELTVEGLSALRVHSVRGEERISACWQLDVIVSGARSEDAERVAVGRRATLVMAFGDKRRAFYGVVSAIELEQVHAIDRETKYVIRVSPRLWLLRRNKRTRVFQNKRVPDIVTDVLVEAGISVRWSLVRPYPRREYCTQYEESDYDFLRRILAEVGIYFYFFGGPPVDGAALDFNTAAGIGASVASGLAGFAAGSTTGGLVGAALQTAETLVPGDSVVCADEALCYPPVAGDDAAALAASTAAAMASTAASALGASPEVSPIVDGASALTGAALAAGTQGGAMPMHYAVNLDSPASSYDKVFHFGLRNSVRPAGAAFRDYDPERPLVLLRSVAVSTAPFPPSPLEITAAAAATAENAMNAISATAVETSSDPTATAASVATAEGIAGVVESAARVPTEIYEHHSPFLFPKWAVAAGEAPLIMRQERRRASVARAESGCLDLSPAHRFALQGHPAPQLDGEYVVTKVRHRGDVDAAGSERRVYSNTFECVPAQMPYPPKRPKRRSVQVALTATVVGPEDEEIHVDEKGQIKVQFHWDRSGKRDEKSSCWIRVMQPWAGAGWGHQFIPRIGMEVVVVFEGGDPDKPMILGSLYNRTHPPSFTLPVNKSQSGIRTRSTPRGTGFNELSFEDANGSERVHLRAQRDYDELVLNDRRASVKRDDWGSVGHDQTRDVGHDQRVVVGHDRDVTVRANDALHVVGARHVRVDQALEERLQTRSVVVAERDLLVVEKDHDTTVGGDLVTRVTGNATLLVGANEAKRSLTARVEGETQLSSREVIDLASDKEILLRVGGSFIRIADGEIEIAAGKVSVRGEDARLELAEGIGKVKVTSTWQVVSDDAIILKSCGASLGLKSEAKLDGSRVLLNSPEQASDDIQVSAPELTTLELVDDDGNPVPYQRYRVRLDSGGEIMGFLDDHGRAKLELSEAGQVSFPELSEVEQA
ncbi:MAG: type VI secretion system tip protein VgrG [Polyangiaceae bacterium]|nr:type VI secretion system tip protein VgrG [Polyangiaceae bacterium]